MFHMKKVSLKKMKKDMINKVFDLGDAKAKDVMVPRVHVVMAEIDSTYKDLLEIFREEKIHAYSNLSR